MQAILLLWTMHVALVSLIRAISLDYKAVEPCDGPNMLYRFKNLTWERYASSVIFSEGIALRAGAHSVKECVCRTSDPVYDGLHFLYVYGTSLMAFSELCLAYPNRTADACPN